MSEKKLSDETIILIAQMEQAASELIDLMIERGMTEQQINGYFHERLAAAREKIWNPKPEKQGEQS